jgi:hypothetical protein
MGSKPRKKPVDPSTRARKKQIHVPVTALDHTVMTARAAACGVSAAVWARLVLRWQAGLETGVSRLAMPERLPSADYNGETAEYLIAVEVSPDELRAFDGAASRGETARGTWARETLRRYAGL